MKKHMLAAMLAVVVFKTVSIDFFCEWLPLTEFHDNHGVFEFRPLPLAQPPLLFHLSWHAMWRNFVQTVPAF